MSMPIVVILGAGPAGLSCALWLVNQGYHPVLLETAAHAGGMLRFNHHSNDWLLGFTGATGYSIGQAFLQHMRLKQLEICCNVRIRQLLKQDNGFLVEFMCQETLRKISADYLVVACGTRPGATLRLQQLHQCYPHLFYIGAGQLNVETFSAGMRVAMLGGGDNAFENAWQLAQRGVNVDVFFRNKPRARKQWVSRCLEHDCVNLIQAPELTQLVVSEEKITLEVNNQCHQVDRVVTMYGYFPNSDMLIDVAPWMSAVLNEKGFFVVNNYQQTVLSRLYAIGDITNHPFQTLPSAIGQGSVAAKAIVADAEMEV